jgi:hypothetical protein
VSCIGLLRSSVGFVPHRNFNHKRQRHVRLVPKSTDRKFFEIRRLNPSDPERSEFFIEFIHRFVLLTNFRTEQTKTHKLRLPFTTLILRSCFFYASLNQATCMAALNQTTCTVITHAFVSPSRRKRIRLSL